MIIAYPKYFDMPIIMEDNFEQLTNEKFMYRGNEIFSNDDDKKNFDEDEFKEIDEEYINSQIQSREYYL